jgi:hypothetical protein
MTTATEKRPTTAAELHERATKLEAELAAARDAEAASWSRLLDARLTGEAPADLVAAHDKARHDVEQLGGLVAHLQDRIKAVEEQEAADAAAAEAAARAQAYADARRTEADLAVKYQKALERAVALYRELAEAGDAAHSAGRAVGRETNTALHSRRRALAFGTSAAFSQVVQAPYSREFKGDPRWRRPIPELMGTYLPEEN